MSGGFAINANVSIEGVLPKPHTFEVFRELLLKATVSPLHISWYGQEWFSDVDEDEVAAYVQHRRTLTHTQALEKLRS